jgi:hypothetical protein
MLYNVDQSRTFTAQERLENLHTMHRAQKIVNSKSIIYISSDQAAKITTN